MDEIGESHRVLGWQDAVAVSFGGDWLIEMLPRVLDPEQRPGVLLPFTFLYMM